MPEFVAKRWYVQAIGFGISFVFLLLSLVHWIFSLLGLGSLIVFLWLLYRTETRFRIQFHRYLLTLTRRIRRSHQLAIHHFPVGVLLYNQENRIEWYNTFVEQMISRPDLIGMKLGEVFPDLKKEEKFQWNNKDRFYQVNHFPKERIYFFQEVTEETELREKYQQEQVALGYIYLDNLEEIVQGLTEQDETLLLNQVYSKISSWAQQYGLFIKRYDEDKMFFVTRKKELEQLMRSQFAILDEVRSLTSHNSLPVTLSIGASSKGESLIDRSQNALAAIDVALARGGDQVAIQTGEKMIFFGGKTDAVEKRTRVRARVISHAIRNLFRDHQQVYIMGHRDPDMDALGAAIGIAKFAKVHDCQAKVIFNEGNASIEQLVQAIAKHDTLSDLFIHSDKVVSLIGHPQSLLVLVDTHKPSFTIDPRLIEQANKVVVIDHHRRGEEFVKDPVLVYIEPYASSTCELVTELIQYEDRVFQLDPLEASALLAGIVVDTKNFAYHAGVRTFEAASFLRRRGADLSIVQSLLQENLDRYLQRSELIKQTELLYDGKIAIAMGEEDERYDQLLIAQAADALVNMQGVKASFVIGRRENGMISVSARSRGELNVQMIMEKMGGGGHFTNAAIQLEGSSLSEVKKQLQIHLEKTIHQGGEGD